MRIQGATSASCWALFTSFAAVLASGPADAPQITAAPDLAKRQTGAIQTCGFVSGQANSPLTCGAGYSCTVDGVANNFFGCCNSFKSCTSDWHTCANFGEPSLGTICSQIYTSCLNCGADTPYCATYKRYLSAGASSPLNSLFCATAATTITALVNAAATSAVESTLSSTPSSSSTAAPGSSPNPTPPNSLGGGAIAGIVVGSIVVVAVLVLGGVGYHRHHKKSVSYRSPSLRSDHGSIDHQATVLE